MVYIEKDNKIDRCVNSVDKVCKGGDRDIIRKRERWEDKEQKRKRECVINREVEWWRGGERL